METPEFITIDKVEDGEYSGKPFKLVTAKDGEQYKFKTGRGECIRNKWHLLEPDKALKLTWDRYKGYDFIADFELVEDVFLAEAVAKTQEAKAKEPDPQAIGLCWKEIGELYRSRMLSGLIGKENTVEAMKAYRIYLLSTLKIPFDGAKLPTFEVKKDETEPS